MDNAHIEELLTREPFGTCTEDEWDAIAAYVLRSLSRFLGVPLEITGDRRPDEDFSYVPLVRTIVGTPSAVDVRIAGMLKLSNWAQARLEVDVLLFLFVQGERVAPPEQIFLTYHYRGPGADPEWVGGGWHTSDFEEQWDPYPFDLFWPPATEDSWQAE